MASSPIPPPPAGYSPVDASSAIPPPPPGYSPVGERAPSRPKYETALTPPEEQQFQKWKQINAPSDSGEDYDLRGAFKGGANPAANGHFPDTWKKPNHPTFSNESMYATPGAPHWEGNRLIAPDGRVIADETPIRGTEAFGGQLPGVPQAPIPAALRPDDQPFRSSGNLNQDFAQVQPDIQKEAERRGVTRFGSYREGTAPGQPTRGEVMQLPIIAGAGILGAAASTAESAVARQALSAADAALSGYFAYQMAKGGAENLKGAYDALKQGDYLGATRELGAAGVQGFFAWLSTNQAAARYRQTADIAKIRNAIKDRLTAEETARASADRQAAGEAQARAPKLPAPGEAPEAAEAAPPPPPPGYRPVAPESATPDQTERPVRNQVYETANGPVTVAAITKNTVLYRTEGQTGARRVSLDQWRAMLKPTVEPPPAAAAPAQPAPETAAAPPVQPAPAATPAPSVPAAIAATAATAAEPVQTAAQPASQQGAENAVPAAETISATQVSGPHDLFAQRAEQLLAWEKGKAPKPAFLAELDQKPEDAAAFLKGKLGASDNPAHAALTRQLAEFKAPDSTHKYASTQLQLPPEIAGRMRQFTKGIPDEHLGEEGREPEGHITALYGLTSDDTAPIQRLLATTPPITVTLGKTSLFKNDDADVLKVDVDSPALHELNAKLAALPNENTHPTYQPHATLAYLKPGQGSEYEGKEIPGVSGQSVVISSLRFSGADGKTIDIPLRGTTKSPEGVGPQGSGVAPKAEGAAAVAKPTPYEAMGDAKLAKMLEHKSPIVKKAAQAEIDKRKAAWLAAQPKPEHKPLPARDDFHRFFNMLHQGDTFDTNEGRMEVGKVEALIMQPIIPGGPGGKWGAVGPGQRDVISVELKKPDGKVEKYSQGALRDRLQGAGAWDTRKPASLAAESTAPATAPPEPKIESQPTKQLSPKEQRIQELQAQLAANEKKLAEKKPVPGEGDSAQAGKILDFANWRVNDQIEAVRNTIANQPEERDKHAVEVERLRKDAAVGREHLDKLKHLSGIEADKLRDALDRADRIVTAFDNAPKITLRPEDRNPSVPGKVSRSEAKKGGREILAQIERDKEAERSTSKRADEIRERFKEEPRDSTYWPDVRDKFKSWSDLVDQYATYIASPHAQQISIKDFALWKAETAAPSTELAAPEAGSKQPGKESPIVESEVLHEQPAQPAGRTRSTGPENPSALERQPPADVSGDGEAGEPAPAGPERGGDVQEHAGGRGGEGASVPVGAGSGPADRVPSGRAGRPAPSVEPAVSHDYRITSADDLGAGGEKTKAKNNLEAIRILKTVQQEGRAATPAEQAQLVKYVGWGQLAPIFDHYRREWSGLREELEGLLTPEEFDAARKSTTNAHYTTPEVITGIWSALQRLGVAGESRVLDPGSGISHFRGLIPEDLLPVKYTGVELDPISGGIAGLLYPSANIQVMPFEKASLPNNFFDAAIGNVPFGNFGVHDARYKLPLATRSIHNYFFVKSLDKLRPGGVLAFVTSSFTMDEVNPAMRKYLASKANLLGAIRLPGGRGGAFARNAGTEVTTDIIVLQKRAPQAEPSGEAWEGLAPVQGKGEGGKVTGIPVNQYYARHPEMMLGEMALEGTMYGPEKSKVLLGTLTPENLAAAVAKLPAGAYDPALGDSDAFRPNPIHELPNAGEIKDGGFGLKDDTVIVREGDTYKPASLTAEQAQRVKGMLAVRDAVRDVFRTQLNGAPEAAVESARKKLNAAYDKFVSTQVKTGKGVVKAGPLNSPDNIKAMAGDPDAPVLASLEDYNREKGTAAKRDIFSKRTIEKYTPIEHVDKASEALAVSLAETGRIDWARMQELTGKTPEEMREEMGSLVFRNPEGHAWETQDDYLSGNVRDKLRAAEMAAATDKGYERNVEALKAVQPKDLTPGQINARLGASWIPTADVRDFIGHLLGVSRYNLDNIRVSHAGVVGHWGVSLGDNVKSLASNTDKWGHGEMTAGKLIEGALNLQSPTIYKEVWVGPNPSDTKRVVDKKATLAAQDKQERIRDEWKKWLWSDGDRANRLSRQYNDEFNNLRLREYDGSHLTFPGMTRLGLRNGDLDAHQKNAIWRQIQSGNTLLAHVVGAGKTFEMIAAGMEMKRLGLIKKPMYVVPNHLVEQWGGDFLRLYPSANVFVAGKEHFSTGNRQKAMSRIATGNYDAVIVAHRSFQFLPVSDATFEAFVREQMTDIDNALHEASLEGDEGGGRRGGKGKKSRSVKELEKARARLEKQLEDRAKREATDKSIDFEQMGVDQIFVDEADMYKNLYYVSKMTRVAGLPNSQSNRAMDMFIKTQYLTRLNNGKRGVVFATGTPIANSMAEMYTMQRYLSMRHLKELGVQAFDSWVQNFAMPQTGMELAPEGTGYRINTRFTKFINVAELLTAFRSFADVKNAEDLNLPRPKLKGGKPIIVSVPASSELKAFVREGLGPRAEAIRSGKVKPWEDNMLAVVGDGRKAALDMRLVAPGLPDNPGSKIQVAVSKVAQIWKETGPAKSTQLMFLDLGTPRPTDIKEKDGEPVAGAQPEDTQAVSTYQDIKNKLVAKGIPAKEIAFIHDAKDDAAKQALFDNVNSGRIRVLIGSTEKMGAGMNVQRKLIALHHLDVPWRPRDIAQRDGRGERQGNENPEIGIYRYVTEDSFDAFMWQMILAKATTVKQAMSGDLSVREIEDVGIMQVSAAEAMAASSGDPDVRERIGLGMDVQRLEALAEAHTDAQRSARMEVASLPRKISGLESARADWQAIASKREGWPAKEEPWSVAGGTPKDATERNKKLLQLALSMRGKTENLQIGAYKGFPVVAVGKGVWTHRENGKEVTEQNAPDIEIGGIDTYFRPGPDDALGMPMRLRYQIDEKPEAEIRSLSEAIATGQGRLRDLQAEAGVPFDQAARLEQMKARLKELNDKLDIDKPDSQAVDLEDGAEEGAAPATGSPDANSNEQKPEGIAGKLKRLATEESGQVDLTRINEYLTKAFGEEGPKANYSGLGAFEDRYLRNLSQLERASQPAHTAAIRAASSRAQSSAILRAAVPAITKALEGSGVDWPELRLALIEGRLRGIRDRWQSFAEQSKQMSDSQLEEAISGHLTGLLEAMEGKRDLPQDVAQTSAALADSKDWDTLRDFLDASFSEAAASVASVMDPARFDAVTEHPKAKEAIAIYKRLVEQPMAENHALNEGVFSDALGPLDTYYPLIPSERPTPAGPGRRLPYHKPRNLANSFATGLAEGYDASMEGLRDRLAKAVRANDKASLIKALEAEGLLEPASPGQQSVIIDGKEYQAERVEIAQGRQIVTGGKSIFVPARMGMMPRWLARELAPILEAQRFEAPTAIHRIMRAVNTFALAGPADFVFHSSNVLGALVANTPFLSASLAGKLGSLPLLKKFTAVGMVLATDPTPPEAAAEIIEMAKVGALPDRYASTTFSKRIAEELGAERQRFSFSPMLYGPKGLDIRARLLMWRLAKQVNPAATPQELYHFVNQLGNYVPALQSEVERGLKASGWSPFFTAGSTMIRNGVNSWTGMGPMPKEGLSYRLWQQLTGGAIALLALWAVTHKYSTGKWPWDDRRAKLLALPVGGGSGPIDKYRHTKIGDALWGSGPEVGYLNFGFFNPITMRGARAMGLPGAFETRQLGGSAGQMAEAAQRDTLNALAHPVLGPAARGAFVGLTGEEPYITGLRDARGKVSLQFFPAINPKTKPGLPAIAERAKAAGKELNAFYGNLGEATGMLGADKGKKGNQYLRMMVDLAAPGLVSNSTNPNARSRLLANQRNGIR